MTATLKIHEKFSEHPTANLIIEKLVKALPYFPELTGEIKVIRIGHKYGTACIANANYHNDAMGFDVSCNPSMNTVFHELGHFMQFQKQGGFPQGEESATIFALARLPEELTDSNTLPYLGIVPRELIREYCTAAIAERNQNGNRRYIKWLKDRISRDRDLGGFPEDAGFDEHITPELKNAAKVPLVNTAVPRQLTLNDMGVVA